MTNRTPECIPTLVRVLSAWTMATERRPYAAREDAWALRRIAMQLHRWTKLECGVERDEDTGKVTWYSSYTGSRSPYPDRETGALKPGTTPAPEAPEPAPPAADPEPIPAAAPARPSRKKRT